MTDSNWNELFDGDDFRKWGYKSSPYRVLVHKSGNGHFAALFTSAFGVDSHLIRGNCGSGSMGKALATAAAREFMSDHPCGCPPPGRLNEGAVA